MHFLTSNFNLLYSNSKWSELTSIKFEIDKNYNNFFFILNNKELLNKFETFHIILNIDNKNESEIFKKLKEIKKIISRSSNKYFFFYIINKLSKSKNLKIAKILNLKNNKNLTIHCIEKKISQNKRNKMLIKFPFDIEVINVFNQYILSNIKIYKSKPYKLIILDCDNTLWGGVLDEDGIKGIQYSNKKGGLIFKEFQNYLKALKEKGFILSISSKNNQANVWKAMKKKKMILQKKDFLSPKINWNEKNLNIKEILLNLGLRSVDTLFIDDNALELKKVKEKIRDVGTVKFNNTNSFLNDLKSNIRLKKLRVLDEDLKKYKYYKIKSKFEDYKGNQKISPKILKNMRQKIKFININKKNFSRAIQLFEKTNQFNFSLNRYNSTDFLKISKDINHTVKLISFKDKFGSHGLIGLYVIKREENNQTIVDFLLSCRVLHRCIEDYVIYCIQNQKKSLNTYINYRLTHLNNELVPLFLKKNNFDNKSKNNNNYVYKIKKKNKFYESKKYFN